MNRARILSTHLPSLPNTLSKASTQASKALSGQSRLLNTHSTLHATNTQPVNSRLLLAHSSPSSLLTPSQARHLGTQTDAQINTHEVTQASTRSAQLDQLLNNLWHDYVKFNPQVLQIHQLFVDQGDTVINDHIAFRTFDKSTMNIDQMKKAFVNLGYQPKDEYHFEAKKLRAEHFEHDEPGRPRIFISELITGQCSPELNRIVETLSNQIDADTVEQAHFVHSGRHWETPSKATYLKLLEESEYAAWVYAFGFRPNHFTVDVNKLNAFESLQEVNAFLKEKGFTLNASGGEIKGNPSELLEQSSTRAGDINVAFQEGNESIPSCYYEFARRYEDSSGELYSGFIAKSADKIFESTDRSY